MLGAVAAAASTGLTTFGGDAAQAANGPLTSPLDVPFWQGQRFSQSHGGEDIGLDRVPVYAAGAGTVYEVLDQYYINPQTPRGGLMIRIYHPSSGLRTTYAHLSEQHVRVNQQVAAGQQIGLVGATGNVTGPHLHFEVWTSSLFSSRSNPRDYTNFSYRPNPSLPNPGGFLMALSDAQQAEIYNALVAQPSGGGRYYKTDALVNDGRANRDQIIAKIQAADYPAGQPYTWGAALNDRIAELKNQVAQLQAAVDAL